MNNIKYIIGIAFILLCTRISAQSLVWEKTYRSIDWTAGGIDADAIAMDAIQTSDGGYIISGVGDNPAGVYFIKTNNKGDTLWTKKYFDGNFISYTCNKIIQVSDGYIAMAWGDYLGCNVINIVKIDNKGDTLWTKSHTCYYYANSMTATPDGGFIILGYKLTDIGYKTFLLKLDSIGYKQWENTYGRPIFTRGSKVVVNHDGSYIFTGSNSLTNNFKNDERGVYVAKIKPNGDSIWCKTLKCQGNTYGQNLIETKDGGYLITGGTDSIDNRGGYIVKTDSNGNTLWEHTYGKTKYDNFGSIIQCNDGGYIIIGTSDIINKMSSEYYIEGDIMISKIDSLGNKLWSKYYGGNLRDEAQILRKTNDGGYIILGNTWSFGGMQRMYLAKLDSAFNVYGAGIGNQAYNNTYNNGFKVFPNPTTNMLTIQYSSSHKNELHIYNTLGEIIYKENWFANQTQKSIDISTLPKGIYIIKIGDGVQKIVIE